MQRRCSGVFILNFEHFSHLFLVFLLFALNRFMFICNILFWYSFFVHVPGDWFLKKFINLEMIPPKVNWKSKTFELSCKQHSVKCVQIQSYFWSVFSFELSCKEHCVKSVQIQSYFWSVFFFELSCMFTWKFKGFWFSIYIRGYYF